MNHPTNDWEGRVQALARTFAYPPTPDLTRPARRPATFARPAMPRWAWAMIIAATVLAGLMAAPGVRAAVVEMLRLGAVRIFLIEPTPSPDEEQAIAAPLASALDLAGETTLTAARQQISFSILLPAYPADLGQPDHVFVQELDGPTVVLVWLQPGREDQARMSLTQVGAGFSFDKRNVRQIEETVVDGRWALWIDGPHLLQSSDGNPELRRLVQGHVLLWQQGDVTYRLETDLPLAEAKKVAESLAGAK